MTIRMITATLLLLALPATAQEASPEVRAAMSIASVCMANVVRTLVAGKETSETIVTTAEFLCHKQVDDFADKYKANLAEVIGDAARTPEGDELLRREGEGARKILRDTVLSAVVMTRAKHEAQQQAAPPPDDKPNKGRAF